jgi:hypothetical protein
LAVAKSRKAEGSRKRHNFIVENPTELLTGLAKGVKVKEPGKQEPNKASAAMVGKETGAV